MKRKGKNAGEEGRKEKREKKMVIRFEAPDAKNQ